VTDFFLCLDLLIRIIVPRVAKLGPSSAPKFICVGKNQVALDVGVPLESFYKSSAVFFTAAIFF